MGVESRVKLTVAGLWHLGCVTSACCARIFDVIGYDEQTDVVEALNKGRAPLFEPGLNELISAQVSARRLRFTSDATEACAGANVLWVTYDTPVNDSDESDVEFVVERVRHLAGRLPPGAVVLISSQLPVGTCRRLEDEFSELHFAYSPENLQLGKAISAFDSPNRIVVGTRAGTSHELLVELLSPFCQNLLWMRTESAEIVKHALNSFLALSITFINEIATICEQTDADAKEVTSGLKSDIRVGPRAYLSAGGAFAGGTLARDIVSLTQLAKQHNLQLEVIPAVKRSNDWHRSWAFRRLVETLGAMEGRRIGLLGLTYKPGTDTLRRSSALELADELSRVGVTVLAHDPVITHLNGKNIQLMTNVIAAAKDVDALVICTEYPEFRQTDWPNVVAAMKRPLILDANRFLETQIGLTRAEYLSVGRS